MVDNNNDFVALEYNASAVVYVMNRTVQWCIPFLSGVPEQRVHVGHGLNVVTTTVAVLMLGGALHTVV